MASDLITIGIKWGWRSSSICFVDFTRSILSSTCSLSNPSTHFSNRLKSFSRLSIDCTSFKSPFFRRTYWLNWIQILCYVRYVKSFINISNMIVPIFVGMRKLVSKIVSVLPFCKINEIYLLKAFLDHKICQKTLLVIYIISIRNFTVDRF